MRDRLSIGKLMVGMKNKNKQLIVVTGAAGFIGSCLVRFLNDQGHDNIIVVDELGQTEKWKNLVGKNFKDIIEKENFFRWLERRDKDIGAIVHLGACTNTTERNASYLLDNNYTFSQQVAHYAIGHNKRFIYASSAATYGFGDEGFSDDHQLLETLRPINMYGYSKHLFDLWLKREAFLDKVVGLKFFNVFGPNEWHKGRMSSAVLHMLPKAQKEGVVQLFRSNDPANYSDGEQQRDFIYVKDVVKMVYSFLQNDLTGIYNIGRGVGATWNELAKAVFTAIGKPARIEYIPMPEDLQGKYQNYTCADMRKSSFKTNSIEEAVKDYVCKHLIPQKVW